ncbi:NPC intracellular cholesterol transporter 1 homolog 1b-like [Leptidea sinapis]|uniref:NPC intracellular cholesterol transporter 1 homolog 1b-like n=1 Tax=Leptidea sinapis TaxID=189913 RepID=UPI0021C2BB6B|nr:NPC intracellular cholesterol transporter 1 homolog 1b-like [Leptidea sinapis]
MKLLLISVICLWLLCAVKAKCLFRGTCAVVNGHPKPCPVNEDPTPIFENLSEDEYEEIFGHVYRRCPHLLFDENGERIPDSNILTCCDPDQIISFSETLNMADGVLGRCPVCIRNFARQICEMNCSPEQSRFTNVTIDETPDGTNYVNEINYRLTNNFMDSAFKSCSEVKVPQTGLPAVNLMCGNAAVCDADAWFGFTGDMSNNPIAPVQVNFIRSNTEEDSMNPPSNLCHETFENDIPCSCLDCSENCPFSEVPVVPPICTVLSVNCYGFSVGIVFFVLSVTLFIIIALFEYRRQRSPPQVSNQETTDNTNKITKLFQCVFEKIGIFSASNPILMIMLTTWVIFAMSFGALNVNLTSNPLELWSSPDSRSRQELNYFNSRFEPFYRAAQIFLTMKGLDSFNVDNITYGPAFRIEAFHELIKLEDAIININQEGDSVKLQDVCFAPLRLPDSEKKLDQCVIMSASAYLPNRNDIDNSTYLGSIQNCLNNYLSLTCQQSWGGGSDPEITFGGYEGDNILGADTLLINFPITNYLNDDDLVPVLEWEQKFIDLMHDYQQNWKADFVDVSFGSERSIQDELERVSRAEVFPIAISYLLMFVYVILALGHIRKLKTFFVDSKIMVALGSIFVVLAAIVCSLGALGFLNVTVTLLAINVIPFFVLSIGIDNVFLMVNSIRQIQSNLKTDLDFKEGWSFEKKKQYVFGKMMRIEGPSMFISSATQVTCFAIGSITNIPAVKTFAIFASFALGILFVFQITTVVAILSLDYKRSSQNRLDIFCCVRKKILSDEEPLHAEVPYESVIEKLMTPYSNALLNWRVKIVVMILFFGFVSISAILIPQLDIGLEQNLALPPDSYVYKYLNAVNDLMKLGPPVYFVLKGGLNFSNVEHQNVVCGGQLCSNTSLTMQLFLASQHSNVTYIARMSNSWIDDFFDWSGLTGVCCRYNITDGSFCPSLSTDPMCQSCSVPRSDFANGLRPAREAFETYIPFFLQDTPTETCNKGGLASYFSNVNYILDSEGRAIVGDSNFMTYHSTLSTSKDYITAVKYGYEISENITTAIQAATGLDVEVFPYSVFYVFYEQYLTTWRDTFVSLSLCVVGAFVTNLIVTGFNFVTTCAMTLTILMVLVDMMGIMYISNIQLNAVSCINLVVSIGITVEFCTHIAYSYAISTRPPNDRVQDAIRKVGATIITGITFTNIPIVVLAFSYTEIIEIFFFRMLLSLVILGFLHGMIFFPVLLSYLNNIIHKV